MPTRCNRGFYCRSYYLLNMFRAQLCPSSGAQEYYTVVAACGISCCGFQVAGLVWSWGLCVRFAGCCSILQTTARNTTGSNHCIILLSSWWWAKWCHKHVEQAIRTAIKTSVASSWHFISTYFPWVLTQTELFHNGSPPINRQPLQHNYVMLMTVQNQVHYQNWNTGCI